MKNKPSIFGEKMKIALLFPPQWTPLNPHFSLASLISQLRSKGHDVNIFDLNVEFYNKILTNEYIFDKVKTAFGMQDKLFQELSKKFSANKKN